MIRKRLPGIVPRTLPTKRQVTRDPSRGLAESRSDFTILVMGFDRKHCCAVIESIYVPEALNQVEAGWMAAEGYQARTGITVQPLYAAAGRINLEKLTADDVVI